MALVHSLWTKPMLNNERGVASKTQLESVIWCHASSVAYAKRLGEPIHLYTDDFGLQLLDLLPYDNIVKLDVPDNIPTDFWAAGKFFAYKKMKLGDIHIDGDVFIKTPILLDRIKQGMASHDLIVQSIENSWVYENEFYINCLRVITANNIHFDGITDYYTPAYNCGLIGFSSDELKHKYIAHYLESIKRIYTNADAMAMIRSNNETWMDLVCEQQHLHTLAKGYKVYNLLGSGDECHYNAKQLGYQHLLGPDKWKFIDKIQQQLYYVDRDIYNSVIKHFA